MKNYTITTIFILLIFNTFSLKAQSSEATGFDGDNFSLEGALDLFKQSKSPEDFEKKLNEKDNDVNNLDINEDGQIDYIRVEDHVSKDAHAIVLQVHLSDNDIQDIAVIAIEKTTSSNATAQIIGDEDIFGSEQIIEPFDMATKQDDASGPNGNIVLRPIIINVWAWPSVRFIYRPSYTIYVSPWGWRHHPRWYRPWRPQPWHIFRPRCRHYHNHFRVTHTHRVTHAHGIYKPFKKKSKVVVTRTTKVRTTRKNKGVVRTKTTHTKVGVKKKNGHVVAGKKTTTKSVKKNNRGKVKKVSKSKTTTKSNGRKTVRKSKTVTKKRK